MKKVQLFIAVLLVMVLQSCVKDRNFPPIDTIFKQPGAPDLGSRSVIHYWNFNNASGILNPNFSIGGASLQYNGAAYDAVNPGSTLNARNGDVEGNGLRLRNPAVDFIISAPTVNYKDVILSFAIQRTNNGAQQNSFSYSIDGTNFITDSLKPNMLKVDTTWQIFFIDFSSIKRVNNNPDFKIKIEFSIFSDPASGNDRYDNISIDANIINPVVVLPEILHYWNFNDPTNINTLISPTSTIGGASLAYVGVWDDFSTGTALNARNGDAPGSALRLRNPAGTFTLATPSSGYKDIVLTLAVQRSNAGAQTNLLTYTLDGTLFSSAGITNNTYAPALDPEYLLVTYNLSAITGVNNNPNLKFKIDFADGSTGTSGNNRFDNIVIEGVRL